MNAFRYRNTVRIEMAERLKRHLFVLMIFVISGFAFENIAIAQTTVTFTSSGSFTVPAGVTSIKVECWGGGGAGGGSVNNKNSGGGGGGGEYSVNPTLSVTPGNSYTITVGAGGTGVTGANGGAGSASSFASLVIANGGSGGLASTGTGATQFGAGGAGGTGGTGTTKYNGGSGGAGFNDANGSGGGGGGSSAGTGAVGGTGGTGTATNGGAGGTAPTGGGAGGAGAAAGTLTGVAGTTPGGGGGGGGDESSGNSIGGAGARGQVLVTYTSTNTITTSAISGSPFCPGASVSVPFTISGTFTSGNVFTAQLSNSSGSFASPTNIGTLTQTTAGTISATIPSGASAGTGYRIRVISDNPAVTGSDNGTNLSVNAPPSISSQPSPSSQSVCLNGTPTNLSVSASAGSGSISEYKWYSNSTASNSGGTLVATHSVSTSPDTYTPVTTSAGTLYYYCIVTNSNGCTVTSNASAAVTVNSLPSISSQPSPSSQSVCLNGTPTNLSVSATAGSGTLVDFKWYRNSTASNSGGTLVATHTSSTSPDTYTPVTTSAGTLYYYCIVSNSNGCTVTSNASASVTVNALPSITSHPSPSSQTVCLSATPTDLSVSASAGSGSILNYKWYKNTTASNSGGTLVATNASSISPNTYTPVTSSVGTLYYYCEVTNSNGCTVTSNASAAVTVSSPPTITLAASPSVCGGTTSANLPYLSTTGSPNQYSITWDGAATTAGFSPVTNASLGSSPIVITVPSGAAAAPYNGTLTVRNSTTGCSSSGTAFTVTVNRVVVTPTVTQPTCYSDGSISLAISGGTSPYTYDWADLTGTNNTKDRTGLQPGSYSVTVTDASGCTVSSGTLTLNTPSGCSGITVCKSDAASVLSVTPDPVNTTYTWTVPSGATINSGQGTPSISVNWTAVSIGAYTVSVVGSNAACGTSAPSTMTVYVQAPTVSATADPTCEGGSLKLYASGGSTYSWSGPNGFSSQSANPVIYNASAATHNGTYSVTVTDSDGCSASTSVSVSINSGPSIPAPSITSATCGASTGAIDITPSGGSPFTYSWSTGATTQDITGVPSGNYTVTVTNVSGCSTSGTYTIQNSDGPSSSLTSTNVSCNGGTNGSINLTVTGGAGSNTFAWTGPGGYTATTEDISSLAAGSYSVIVTDAASCTTSASVTITQPNVLQADGVVGNINCYGSATGTITLTVSGGTPNGSAPYYSYAWTASGGGVVPSGQANNQNLTLLVAGTYSVVITDANSCTLNKSFTVTQPSAALSATPTITNVSCNGGSNGQVTLAVSGGTSPYTYSWTGPSSFTATTKDISARIAGTYNVTITDSKGCTFSLTGGSAVVITEPSVLSLSKSKTDVSCNGGANGAVDLTVSGGTSAYSYIWSNGATTQDISSLTNGTYSVTVTDSKGCTASTSETVSQPAVLTGSASATAPSCNGGSNGSINLTVSGGNGTNTFLWSNAATTEDLSSLSAGTYSVTITDSKSCTATATATVTNPTSVSVTGTITNVACNGASTGAINITASGGTGSYTYNWGGGVTSEDRSTIAAGTYSVTVSDGNSCTASASYTITQPTALALSTSKTDITCNGNNDGSINLSVSGGVTPYTYAWTKSGDGGVYSSTTEDISSLSAGTYNVTVTDGNGCTANTSATITQPSALSGSAVPGNVTCYNGSNGSVNLTVSGGNGSNTFLWSNAATTEDLSSLTAGSYNVTITDSKGCTATASATVTQPTQISISGAVTNVVCNGSSTGAINMTVSGGTPNGSAPYYTYAWTGPSSYTATTEDISSIGAGTYNITVTDASGCTKVSSFTVLSSSAISVNINITNRNCLYANGAVSAVVSGGTGPYNYSWTKSPSATVISTSNTITGQDTGTYNVTVTDANGCTSSNSGTVAYLVESAVAINAFSPATSSRCQAAGNVIYNTTANNAYQLTYSLDATSLAAGNSINSLSGEVSFVSTWSGPTTITATATGCSGPVATNHVVTVYPTTVGGSVSGSSTVCTGTNSTTLTLSGNTGTVTKWQYSNNSFLTDVHDIASTATSYSAVNLTSTTYYRAVVTSGDCSSAISDVAVVVVSPTSVGGTAATDQIICSGSSPSDITLSSSTGNIQWQVSSDNSTFSDISGATASPLTSAQMGTLTATRYYKAVVTSGACSLATSNTVTATVNSVSGGVLGSNQFVPTSGDPAAFSETSASTGSGTLSYKWQSSTTSSSSGFSDISSATGTTYDPPSGITATTYYKRITSSNLSSVICTAESNLLTVTVGTCVDPSITGQPTSPSAVCAEAGTATMSVTATGSVLTYQWYVDDTTPLTNVTPYSGVTSATLTITNPSVSLNGKQYKVIVSGACGSPVTSNTVNLTVNPTSVGGTASATATTVCSGSSTTVSVSGQTGSIQWQQSSDGSSGWANVSGGSGATTATYTTPNLSATTYYRAVVTSGVCSSANSSTASVTVDPISVGGTASATATTVCSGSSTTVSVSGQTGSIQWQQSSDGSSGWVNVSGGSGATTATYTTPNLSATTYYRAVVTSGVCSSANSSTASVTVNSVSGGGIASNQTVPTGGDPLAFTEITASTGSGTLSYKWQSSTTSSSSGFSDIGSATSTTYDVPSGISTTTYFKRITTSTLSTVACTAESNVLTVTVGACTNPSIDTQPLTPSAICSGSGTATISVSASGTNVTYQWYVDGSTAVTNTAPYSGATSSTLTITNPSSSLNGKQYKVIVSGDCGSPVTSNTVTVTVDPISVGGTASATVTTVCSGSSTTVSVSGQTGSIQWQQSSDGSSGWANVSGGSGATTATYTTPNLSATTYYRAVVTSGVCSSANSSTASVTVNTLPSTPTGSSTQNICGTATVSSLSASVGIGETVEWYTTTTGGSVLSASASLTAGATYYAQAKNSTTGCVSSGRLSVTINLCPNAVADAISVSEGGTVSTLSGGSGTVLNNDSDPEGNSITSILVSGPSNGTLSLNTNGTFIYTHNGGETTSDSFTYKVNDGSADGNTVTVVITISPVNDAPVAGNDSANTNEDESVAINVISNDSDVDGTIDSATVDLDPAVAGIQNSFTDSNGNQWSVNSSGVVSFVPENNYNGNATINYTVKDDSGAVSNIATITVTIAAVNDAPVAVNDNVGTSLNTPVTTNILSNDSDVDGNLDPTTVTVVTTPVHGAVSVNATTGAITYTPNTDYFGIDSYEYRVCDTSGACAQAIVSIQVPQASPVAVNDTKSTSEDTSVDINVTGNDYDPQNNIDVTTVSIVSGPTHGTAVVNAVTGIVTYLPDANFNGTDQFTYRVCDLTSLCSQANVYLTVTSVNDAPVAIDDVATINEDETLSSANLLGNDSDPDGDVLTINTTPVSGPAHGTLTINTNGTYTYIPTSNYNGTDSFTYQVCDNGIPSLCDNAMVTITISAVNDAPNAVDDVAVVSEDGTLNGSNLLANDSDVEGNTLTISTSPVSGPSHGTLVINVTGTYTYSPDADYTGTDSFVYQVCDNGSPSQCSNATVSITVTPVNDPPVAVNDNVTTNEDTSVSLNVSTNDTDVDGTVDVSTVDLNPSVSGIQTSFTDSNGNQWSVNSFGVVSFIPESNYNGTATINYTIQDNSGATSNIGIITVTVSAVNDTPVALNDNAGAALNTPVVTNVLANDTDVDGNLDPSTVTIITAPIHGFTTVNSTTGAITYTPNAGYFGTDNYVYRVCDTNGACAQATVSIQIPPIAPVAVNDIKTTNEDTPVVIDVVANDYDPQGDFNYGSVSVKSGPTHGTVSVNATTGVITYTPDGNYNGSDQLTYEVCDLTGFCSQALVILTITPVNDNPVATDDIATVSEDGILNGKSLLLNDSDPDGNTITINTVPVSGPTHGTLIINANGTYVYTPIANYNGSDSFIYQICDNGSPSLCDNATVTITVNPVNDAPVANNDTGTVDEDGILNGANLLLNDTDTENNTLAINTTPVTEPAHGTLVINSNGTYTYTPDPNYNGTDSFVYEVCDNGSPSLCNNATVIITVNPVNDAPIAVNDVASISEDGVLLGSTLLANDFDPEGNSLTIDTNPVSGPTHGILLINANGTYSYTPASNYYGNDSFVYKICDNGIPSLCSTGTVTITVNAVNDPPVAVNDFATIAEDGILNGANLLGNDSDPEGNALTINTIPVGGPSHGTLTINPTGTYTYVPVANYYGTDQFTYQVCDNGVPSQCSSATVTITINAVNDPPVANDDSGTVKEDESITINVLANDNDPEELLSGNNLSISATPQHGTVLINALSGSITYFPNSNYNGPDSFIYNICDSQGLCNQGTVDITVNPVNDMPLVTDDLKATEINTPTIVSVLENDNDIDGQLDLASLQIKTPPKNGTVSVDNVTGKITYTPVTNFSGTDSFEYLICDNTVPAACGQATVTIKVSDNHDPLLVDDINHTIENNPINESNGSGSLLINDTDPDGHTLIVTSINGVLNPDNDIVGEYGILNWDSDGTYIYTPNTALDSLNLNETVVETFTYTASDGNGGSASAKLRISISGNENTMQVTLESVCINDAPYINYNVSLNFTSGNNPVTIRWIDSHNVTVLEQSGLPISSKVLWPGAVVDSDGMPTDWPGWILTDGIWIMGSDGYENTRPISAVEISVNPVVKTSVSYPPATPACYAGPVMNIIDDKVSVKKDEVLVIDIHKNDSGIGDGFKINIPAVSSKGGTIVHNPDGTVTYTPPIGFVGKDTFTYEVCNTSTLVVCQQAIVTIEVFVSLIDDDDHDGISNLAEDLNGDGNPANDDSDGDGIPNYLDTDDDNDGNLTKDEAYNGNSNPVLQDSDNDGIPDYLDVDDDNDGVPTIIEDLNGDGNPANDDTDGDGIPNYLDTDDDNDTVLTKNEAYNGNTDPTKQDSDGDGIPDYLDTDDDGDGVLTKDEDVDKDGNPANDDLDKNGLPNYLDWDDDGDGIPSRRELLDLNGNGIPDYLETGSLWPQLAIDDVVETGVDASISFFPLANDSLSFDPGKFVVITYPDHGTITYDPGTGEMIYTPDLNYTGTQEIVYEVCNNFGECDRATIIITVVDIIDPPQIVTPNDDGTNDRWIVSGLVHYPDNKVSIFNRWGNLVFEKVGYINEWDGTSNQKKIGNSPLPVGTYYYIITYGTNLHKTGYVVLDR